LNGIVLPVLVTLAIQILASLAVFTPPVLAPEASREMGLDASAVGVVTSVIYLSSAAAALMSGGFIVRYGPLRVSQIALLLVAVGSALLALGHPLAVLAAALFIGLGYGPVTPSSSAILGVRTPERLRAFVFSLKQTGVPIGGAIAGAMVPVMMVWSGWRSAALAVACGSLLLAFAVQGGRATADRDRRPDAPLGALRLREPLRMLWSQRPLRDLALASFAYSGMQMCLGSYLVVYLHEIGRLSVPAAGAALSVAMAGAVLGRLFWGFVADNFIGPRRLLGLLGMGMSLGAFTLGLLDAASPWAAVVMHAFLFGATAVGWNGVYISEVARIAPKGHEAAVTGASFALTYLGVFVSPLVVWAVVAIGAGYAGGFAFVGLLTLWRASVFFRR